MNKHEFIFMQKSLHRRNLAECSRWEQRKWQEVQDNQKFWNLSPQKRLKRRKNLRENLKMQTLKSRRPQFRATSKNLA